MSTTQFQTEHSLCCCRDNGVLVTDAQEPAPPLLDQQQQRLVDTPLFVPDTPTRRAGARLVLNHYITRSREDFSVKQHRGAGARSQTKGLYRSKAWFEDMKCVPPASALFGSSRKRLHLHWGLLPWCIGVGLGGNLLVRLGSDLHSVRACAALLVSL